MLNNSKYLLGLSRRSGRKFTQNAKIIINHVGHHHGVEHLGKDLLGKYGMLRVAGIDDFTDGFIGDALFNPGAILELEGHERIEATRLGIASGMSCHVFEFNFSIN